MIVVAVVYLEEGHTTNTTSILLKVGAALVLLSWVLLGIWTYVSRLSKTDIYTPGYEAGTLVSICFRPAYLKSTDRLIPVAARCHHSPGAYWIAPSLFCHLSRARHRRFLFWLQHISGSKDLHECHT
jgi:hypothetical protein